ncbi:hypothetical protein CPB83DRAFT_778003 [Crepidotus variabilis]|uniref:Uncharacterized protein n=1 Tax=Crepidotus variabilis TaxID=179855 RepID=A0A9P6E3L3_9AGAR|nr:hypothetical protein CPB83DRAFT_778003 [Crepidotus variabilis]
MYNFHASANAYMMFWNHGYGSSSASSRADLGRRHIWQAFVQESIRMVAAASDRTLETQQNIPIEDLTKFAFDSLGDEGKVCLAEGHDCSECTKPYRTGIEEDTEVEGAEPVKMIVIDGVVIGSAVSLV